MESSSALDEPVVERAPQGAVSTAVTQAAATVAAARDDPAKRLALAASFYALRPGRKSIARYRLAEMAFMRWQVERGVLAGPRAARPGSPWWRAVNAHLLHDTSETYLLAAGRPGEPSRLSVAHWLSFLDAPSASAWYRAHNASIVGGYLTHRDLTSRELPVERFFMDVALLRVLYAHCLVAAPRLALGRLAPLSRILGDPRLGMAGAFLSLGRVVPNRYPLENVVLDRFIAAENRLGRVLDYAVIAPRLEALYVFSAAEIGEPRLLEFIHDGFPVYAWPYEERHVWTVANHRPLLARALSRVTAPLSPRAGFS
jgi:hypothetical protein